MGEAMIDFVGPSAHATGTTSSPSRSTGRGESVDLIVPAEATVADVAREYADQVGVADLPLLYTAEVCRSVPTGRIADSGAGERIGDRGRDP